MAESNSKTLLVIDDNQEILSIMRMALESQRYEYVTAQDREAGLGAIGQVHPDLIIVNRMSKSGFLAVEQINRRENPLPIIMITANEGGRRHADAERVNVKAYLHKPFAMQVWVEQVDRFA